MSPYLIWQKKVGEGSGPPVVNDGADMQLLIQSETTDGSTTFVDTSGNSRTVTRIADTTGNGTPVHSTSQAKWGNSSIFSQGRGGYLSATIPDITTQDFTIEFWWRMSVTNLYQLAFNIPAPDNNSRIRVHRTNSGDNIRWEWGGGLTWTDIPVAGATLNNNWFHLAYVRSGNNLNGYVNGVNVISNSAVPANFNLTTPTLYVGGDPNFTHPSFHNNDHYIEDFRYSHGAVYTSAFTPPTSNFAAG